MQIHLDLVGGLAGDMFIAAMLDAFPHHEARVRGAIQSVSEDLPVYTSCLPWIDGGLRGRRFTVERAAPVPEGLPEWSMQACTPPGARAEHGSDPGHAHPGHAHVDWHSIRARLLASSLEATVRAHALALFGLLAEAEAAIHGVPAESVCFHEVGAWDSIADIVGAAVLIDAVGAERWTCSPIPLGGGRTVSAHGILPLPAPATVWLLTGMPTVDDGVAGERVTPTGAAILRYLCSPTGSGGRLSAESRTLRGSGTGFGSRRLAGLSNHVRVLCFESTASELEQRREMHALEFEIDDQSAEDLAVGLDRLRQHEAVLDVTQAPVFGKKGRMMTQVRVLARHGQLDSVVEACFRETTTIGLRHKTVQGIGLKRRVEELAVDGHRLRVKVVERPGGPTAKTESDDVLEHADHRSRVALRIRAEHRALLASGAELGA